MPSFFYIYGKVVSFESHLNFLTNLSSSRLKSSVTISSLAFTHSPFNIPTIIHFKRGFNDVLLSDKEAVIFPPWKIKVVLLWKLWTSVCRSYRQQLKYHPADTSYPTPRLVKTFMADLHFSSHFQSMSLTFLFTCSGKKKHLFFFLNPLVKHGN